MSLIRTALPFAVFVVCQMFQSRCVASTTEQAISATVSGVAQVHVPAAKRKRSRWLLDQPALPFAVAFRRVTANFEQRSTQAQAPDAGQTLLDASAIPTARTRWMSEQALGRRWVVLLLAPRIQQTARGGRYGQQSVPQPQVLLTLAQMAKQLTNRGAETFLILPDSKAEEKTYNLLQQSRPMTGDNEIDALRLWSCPHLVES